MEVAPALWSHCRDHQLLASPFNKRWRTGWLSSWSYPEVCSIWWIFGVYSRETHMARMVVVTFFSWSLLPGSPRSTICTRAGCPSRACTLWSSESFLSSLSFFPIISSEKKRVQKYWMKTLLLKLKRVHTKFPYHRFWSSSWSIGNCGGILAPSFNGKPGCKWVQGRQAAGTYQILTFTQPPLQCYPLSKGRTWLFSQSINDSGWYL